MTSFKLNSLSIFLILLFVIVFAMVFKNYWDSLLETKEGFAPIDLANYSGGKVEQVYTNLYFDPETQSLLEKITGDSGSVTIQEIKRIPDDEIEESIDSEPAPTTESFTTNDVEAVPFVHKMSTDGSNTYVVYIPSGEDATFLHVLDSNRNLISQYYNNGYKSEKSYEESTSDHETKTGTGIVDLDFKSLPFSEDDKDDLKTSSLKLNGGDSYAVAMKYLHTEVLVGFKASTTDKPEVLLHKKQTVETSSSTDKSIQFKFGDYEISLPQDTAESLASKLGTKLGSNLFMKGDDYNSDYIHKNEIIPGMGYDHYHYGMYDRPSQRYGGKRGYYDSDVRSERREGPRDENGNLIRDFGEGTTDLLRDGIKGTTDVAKDTVRGTVDIAKETVGGATDLARETASGTVGLAKETVGGATGLVKETASGAKNVIGDTLSGTGDFVQSSASGIGQFAKDAASGTVGLAKDVVGGTVGLAKDVVGGVGSGVGGLLQGNPTQVGGGYGGRGGGYLSNGHQNSYGGPNMRQTHGMDPYSYYGTIPPRPGHNYVPRTADFSAFGR